jgi:hypothetical protein
MVRHARQIKTSSDETSARIKVNRRFSDALLAVLQKSRGLRLRAGMGPHRFIGIWFVLVENRVLIRSWSVKPDGWYRRFLNEPRGTIQVGDHEVAVRAVPVKSERLRHAVDRAYSNKYNTPGALKYAKDLAGAKSRATTTELVPASIALLGPSVDALLPYSRRPSGRSSG